MTLKLPYGISDFQVIRMEGYFYQDRTYLIPIPEDTGKQLLFLRPRRFGKSLLLSMLENYYDIKQADQFEELFGSLAIGQNPTPAQNQYVILHWDFSVVKVQGEVQAIEKALHQAINMYLERCKVRYKLSFEIHEDNAICSFGNLLNAVQNERDTRFAVARTLCQYGNMEPLYTFIEQRLFPTVSNRDYRWSNELAVKIMFMTVLFNDRLYMMVSETEVDHGYIDLSLILRPDARQYQALDLMLEFKYIGLNELGLTGSEVRALSREALAQLPAVTQKLAEATVQAERYGNALKTRYGLATITCFAVVAAGLERIVYIDCT